MNSIDFFWQCNLSRVERAIEHRASHKRDSKAIKTTCKGVFLASFLVKTFKFGSKKDFIEKFKRSVYIISNMRILDMHAHF